MYQPSGRAPVASVWMRIAAAISTRSSDSDMSLCSIHFRLWLAMSQPASFMAATTSGISLQRHRDAEHGHRQIAFGEHPPQPPEAGARAIFEHRFDIGVALAGPGLRTQYVGQERFRGAIAVENIVLAAFLEIHHELHRDPRVARPFGIGRVAPVAAEVARVSRRGHAYISPKRASKVNSPARTISWLIDLFFRMYLTKWFRRIHCSRDRWKQGPFRRPAPHSAGRIDSLHASLACGASSP